MKLLSKCCGAEVLIGVHVVIDGKEFSLKPCPDYCSACELPCEVVDTSVNIVSAPGLEDHISFGYEMAQAIDVAEKLTTLFDDLKDKAYNDYTHSYEYKEANQVIRKHFEKHFKENT